MQHEASSAEEILDGHRPLIKDGLQVLNELFKEPDSIFNKRIAMRPEVYQFCKDKTKILMKHFYGLDIDV